MNDTVRSWLLAIFMCFFVYVYAHIHVLLMSI